MNKLLYQIENLNPIYEMVVIPQGNFLMGASRDTEKNTDLDELPRRSVWLSTYMIQSTPVTVGQWNEFLQDTGYTWQFQSAVADVSPAENYPVTYVSWHDACEFTKWMSERLNRTFSLPTEAQWEKACRGENGQLYPWGNKERDDTDELLLAKESHRESYAIEANKTSKRAGEKDVSSFLTPEHTNYPVGWRPELQSPFGCLDMWMNVAEWCLDWFDYYQPENTINPVGPALGKGKVLRGGDIYLSGWPRCSHRRNRSENPETRAHNIGFRIVCATEQE